MHGSVWDMHVICMDYVWNTCGLCIRDMGSAWYIMACACKMQGICMEYVWTLTGYVCNMYGVCMQYSVLSLPRPLFKQQQTPKSEQFEEGLKRV